MWQSPEVFLSGLGLPRGSLKLSAHMLRQIELHGEDCTHSTLFQLGLNSSYDTFIRKPPIDAPRW